MHFDTSDDLKTFPSGSPYSSMQQLGHMQDTPIGWLPYVATYFLALAISLKLFRIRPPYARNILGEFGNTEKWRFAILMGAGSILCPIGLSLVKIGAALTPDFQPEAITLASLLISILVAPLLEEVLFRGVIFRQFKQRKGPLVALIISATLFGFIHGAGKFPTTFIFGILLGLIYNRVEIIWPGILLHALNNGFFDLLQWSHHFHFTPKFILQNYVTIGVGLLFFSLPFIFFLIRGNSKNQHST